MHMAQTRGVDDRGKGQCTGCATYRLAWPVFKPLEKYQTEHWRCGLRDLEHTNGSFELRPKAQRYFEIWTRLTVQTSLRNMQIPDPTFPDQGRVKTSELSAVSRDFLQPPLARAFRVVVICRFHDPNAFLGPTC